MRTGLRSSCICRSRLYDAGVWRGALRAAGIPGDAGTGTNSSRPVHCGSSDAINVRPRSQYELPDSQLRLRRPTSHARGCSRQLYSGPDRCLDSTSQPDSSFNPLLDGSAKPDQLLRERAVEWQFALGRHVKRVRRALPRRRLRG